MVKNVNLCIDQSINYVSLLYITHRQLSSSFASAFIVRQLSHSQMFTTIATSSKALVKTAREKLFFKISFVEIQVLSWIKFQFKSKPFKPEKYSRSLKERKRKNITKQIQKLNDKIQLRADSDLEKLQSTFFFGVVKEIFQFSRRWSQ